MNRILAGVLVLLATSTAARADDAEDKAVKMVEKLGGEVTRDEKKDGKPVVKVELRKSKVKDADLKELAALKSLATLDLSSTEITGTGLNG